MTLRQRGAASVAADRDEWLNRCGCARVGMQNSCAGPDRGEDSCLHVLAPVRDRAVLPALGTGAYLALCGDIVLAERRSYLCFPEARARNSRCASSSIARTASWPLLGDRHDGVGAKACGGRCPVRWNLWACVRRRRSLAARRQRLSDAAPRRGSCGAACRQIDSRRAIRHSGATWRVHCRPGQ